MNCQNKTVTIIFPVEVKVMCNDEGTAQDMATALMEAAEKMISDGEVEGEGVIMDLTWDMNRPKFEHGEE